MAYFRYLLLHRKHNFRQARLYFSCQCQTIDYQKDFIASSPFGESFLIKPATKFSQNQRFYTLAVETERKGPSALIWRWKKY